MTVSVTTDLATVSLAESTADGGTWNRISGTSSGNPAADADAFVQGTNCVAAKMGATTAADVGVHFNHTTTFDLTNKVLFYWRQIVTPGNMQPKASGGIAIGLTNTSTTGTTWSTTNLKRWYIDGSDTMPISPGWVPYCLDPLQASDVTTGTLTLSTLKNIGFLCNQVTSVTTTVSNQFVDAVRMGTGLTVTCSSGADVVTFSSIYTVDNTVANRWGLLTQRDGIYYGIGVFNIGSASQANVCNFTDSGQVLVWRKNIVANTYYKFNLISASATNKTTMSLTSCVIRGQSGQKWSIACDTNSAFTSYTCSIADINTAVLSAGSILSGTSFNACGLVTSNGAQITGSTFTAPTSSSQILCTAASQVNNITNTTFNRSGTTSHAIEITGTAGNFTLSGVTFNGYAASNGSTGTEAVFVNIATGNVQITALGGSNPSIRTAGATVTFAATPVSLSITVKEAATGAVVQNARVLVEKVSDGTDLLAGLTNASGVVSGSFSYTSDTPIQGVVRRATAAYGTLYKPSTISGTITSAGFSATILLTSDE